MQAHGKNRVHALAKEVGVTAKEVLRLLGGWGEVVKSASSVVEAPLARRVREHYATQLWDSIAPGDYGISVGNAHTNASDGGFAAAYEQARRNSRGKPAAQKARPGEIEAAIYRHVIDPGRTRQGRYTPEERDRAERLTRQWALTWLPDVVGWIRVSGGKDPTVSAKLSERGLTPDDAELRLGFGRLEPTRNTIIQRVMSGNLGVNDAVRQVMQFRLSDQATGSE